MGPGRAAAINGLGVVRMAVGVAMILAPRAIGRSDDPSFKLLMRTIGVRDLVLGTGAALAAQDSAREWGAAALASDAIDVLVGSLSARGIGRTGGAIAALTPVPFAAADLWALARPAPRGLEAR